MSDVALTSPNDLRKVAENLLKLAEKLETSTEASLIHSAPEHVNLGSEPLSRASMRAWASQEYKSRRARSNVFDEGLFREPAWDMLLTLFIAHLDMVTVRVMNVCDAAQVPTSTALRWLGELEAQGLVTRSADGDARASRVAMSERGVAMMTKYTKYILEERVAFGLPAASVEHSWVNGRPDTPSGRAGKN